MFQDMKNQGEGNFEGQDVLKNKDYWRERFSRLERSAYAQADRCTAQLEKIYQEAQQTVLDDLERWYACFAQNNQVTLAEARKLLAKGEPEEFRRNVKRYRKEGRRKDLSSEWQKKLSAASSRM